MAYKGLITFHSVLQNESVPWVWNRTRNTKRNCYCISEQSSNLYVARVNENLDQSGTLHSYCVFQIAYGGRRKKVGCTEGGRRAEEDKGRLKDFRLQLPADAFSFLYTFICELIDHVYYSSKNDSSTIKITPRFVLYCDC
jgi:hypothetical protein